MKKAIALVLICLFALTLTACSPERHTEIPKVTGLYSVKDCYKNGWISKTDLKNIAYYFNGMEAEEGFEPQPKDPATLGDVVKGEIATKYIADFKAKYKDSDDPKAINAVATITAQDISFKYYGCYSGCYAVQITNSKVSYLPNAVKKYKIGGVAFYDFDALLLTMWVVEDVAPQQ